MPAPTVSMRPQRRRSGAWQGPCGQKCQQVFGTHRGEVLRLRNPQNCKQAHGIYLSREFHILTKILVFLNLLAFASINSTTGFLYRAIFFPLQRYNLYHFIKILYKLSVEKSPLQYKHVAVIHILGGLLKSPRTWGKGTQETVQMISASSSPAECKTHTHKNSNNY